MNGKKARKLRKTTGHHPNNEVSYRSKKQYQIGIQTCEIIGKKEPFIIKETGTAKVLDEGTRKKYKTLKKMNV